MTSNGKESKARKTYTADDIRRRVTFVGDFFSCEDCPGLFVLTPENLRNHLRIKHKMHDCFPIICEILGRRMPKKRRANPVATSTEISKKPAPTMVPQVTKSPPTTVATSATTMEVTKPPPVSVRGFVPILPAINHLPPIDWRFSPYYTFLNTPSWSMATMTSFMPSGRMIPPLPPNPVVPDLITITSDEQLPGSTLVVKEATRDAGCVVKEAVPTFPEARPGVATPGGAPPEAVT